MLEIGVALAFLVALGALGLALAAAPSSLLTLGVWLAAAGLAFGVPTGLAYHVALRRALLGAGRLPDRWWLHPTSLHDEIPPPARPTVLAWCHAGALGFLVTIAGCALVALAAWRTF